MRNELTDEWQARGAKEGVEYAVLTNEISKGTFGFSVAAYKQYKLLAHAFLFSLQRQDCASPAHARCRHQFSFIWQYTNTIINGGATVLPTDYKKLRVSLISGDINDDNVLDVTDYNLFIDCSNKNPDCTPDLMAASDLDDNGSVDNVDYNILLADFATTPPCPQAVRR